MTVLHVKRNDGSLVVLEFEDMGKSSPHDDYVSRFTIDGVDYFSRSPGWLEFKRFGSRTREIADANFLGSVGIDVDSVFRALDEEWSRALDEERSRGWRASKELAQLRKQAKAEEAAYSKALRDSDNYIKPSPERDQAIVAARRRGGETYASIGFEYGLSATRIMQICKKQERKDAFRRNKAAAWRIHTRGGHPDFHDAYGIAIVSTPRDVWLDDRFAYGKTFG